MGQNSFYNKLPSLTIDPGASGDSWLQYAINTTDKFRVGVDDDDSDSYKISLGSALGTNDAFVMTSAGELTLPLQPSFLAYNSVTDTNVTGNGATYTFICDTEVFDQNSDYNNGTGTFTAPVTGRYTIGSYVQCEDLTSSFTSANPRVVTSNRTYRCAGFFNPGTYMNASNICGIGGTILADMDAGDTATFDMTISGSTLTVDIYGGSTLGTYVFALLEV